MKSWVEREERERAVARSCFTSALIAFTQQSFTSSVSHCSQCRV